MHIYEILIPSLACFDPRLKFWATFPKLIDEDMLDMSVTSLLPTNEADP